MGGFSSSVDHAKSRSSVHGRHRTRHLRSHSVSSTSAPEGTFSSSSRRESTSRSRRSGRHRESGDVEAAIGVLGETNLHARPLLNALRVAKLRLKLPPVEERVEACKTHLECARLHVIRAEEDHKGRLPARLLLRCRHGTMCHPVRSHHGTLRDPLPATHCLPTQARFSFKRSPRVQGTQYCPTYFKRSPDHWRPQSIAYF